MYGLPIINKGCAKRDELAAYLGSARSAKYVFTSAFIDLLSERTATYGVIGVKYGLQRRRIWWLL